jgi:hypothetical protein
MKTAALALLALSLFDVAIASCAHGSTFMKREVTERMGKRGLVKRVAVATFGYMGAMGPYVFSTHSFLLDRHLHWDTEQTGPHSIPPICFVLPVQSSLQLMVRVLSLRSLSSLLDTDLILPLVTDSSTKLLAPGTLKINMPNIASAELDNLGTTVELAMLGKNATTVVDGKT